MVGETYIIFLNKLQEILSGLVSSNLPKWIMKAMKNLGKFIGKNILPNSENYISKTTQQIIQ